MSQIIPVQAGQFTPPNIPQELAAHYASLVERMNSGFSANYNFIRPGKMDFTLTEGGVPRQVANGQVVGVCLGIAPHDFCTWYAKKYTPGQEPERPDLLWEWPNRDAFPDALPVQYRQKVMLNGSMRWDFRIARRSVWALATTDANGQMALNLSSPYILDITSMSLFGKSNTQVNQYRWSGLIGFCNRFSQPPHFVCSPSVFLTQLLLDATSSVSGVMVFRPMLSPDGNAPQYLDSATFSAVVNTMLSQQVQDMLKVREILDYTPAGASAQSAPEAPQPTVQPVVTGTPPVRQFVQTAAAPAAPQPAAPVQQWVQPSEAGTVDDLLGAASEMLYGGAQPATSRTTAAAQQSTAPVQPSVQQPVQPAAAPAAPQPASGGVNMTTAAAISALDDLL